ncbi:ankyrin repeat-containing domain protein [Penicillium sp. IBT 35674x]|nr:ankyrin repeat-containing domain protein [Penicillium sp. IBT 35674x]
MDSLSPYRDIISKLYLDENHTLSSVRSYIKEEYGILASRGVYQRAFVVWNFRKNKPGQAWVWVDHGIKKRTEMGKKSNVIIRGTPWATNAVNKEISRHVTTVDRVQAGVATPETPEGYAIVTPAASSAQQQTPVATPNLETELMPDEPVAEDRELLAKLLEDCGSFVSTWAMMGYPVRRESLINSYRAIAQRLTARSWDQELYSNTHRLLPDIVFDIFHSVYRNLPAGLQLQLDQLPKALSRDTVRTAMFIAAAKGCIEVARTLFSLDVEIDSRDSKGQTCLHLAALHNHIDMVSYLISQKANVNQRRRDGQTVWTLICALETHEQISHLLIQAGADKHAVVDQMNPLYTLAAGGYTNSVRLLLRQGVNPSIQTVYRWAPLHWAASNGHFEIVKILVKAGAELNCVSDTGKTPLGLVGNKWPEISEYLQLHGARMKATARRIKAPPRKRAVDRSHQSPTPPRARLSTVDSTRTIAVSPQTADRGTSQISSVKTPVANATFESIYGEASGTGLVFQSPTLSNNGLLPPFSNWVQLESTNSPQMPSPRW